MKFARNIQWALLLVLILWGIHFLNSLLPLDLRAYGIRPRQTDGLEGILFMPFLHANVTHLAANSGALVVLLTVALTYSRIRTFAALATIILFGGLGVWVFGQPRTVHIGASGVIFGLIGFLLFIGIFRREWKAFFITLIAFFLYGGALLSLLVYVPGVSWSAHFWGFGAGVLAAWWMRTPAKKPIGKRG